MPGLAVVLVAKEQMNKVVSVLQGMKLSFQVLLVSNKVFGSVLRQGLELKALVMLILENSDISLRGTHFFGLR